MTANIIDPGSTKVNDEDTKLASVEIEESPVEATKAPTCESWQEEWAVRHILMPACMFLVSWTLLSGVFCAGEISGKNDLGIQFLATNWMFFHLAIAVVAFPFLMHSGLCKWEQMPWVAGVQFCCYALH